MPYTHGGDIYGDAAVELDFSVNTNRLGMPQAVRDAVMASGTISGCFMPEAAACSGCFL